MKTEFRKASVPEKIPQPDGVDRRIFPASDCFDAEYWRECEAWWLLAGGVKMGCCAFEAVPGAKPGGARQSLYIGTTGILPKYRGMGFGRLMKAWEVAGVCTIATATGVSPPTPARVMLR